MINGDNSSNPFSIMKNKDNTSNPTNYWNIYFLIFKINYFKKTIKKNFLNN
jgi:hypothetical protein